MLPTAIWSTAHSNPPSCGVNLQALGWYPRVSRSLHEDCSSLACGAIVWLNIINISEDPAAFIFRAKNRKSRFSAKWQRSTRLHGVTSETRAMIIVATSRINRIYSSRFKIINRNWLQGHDTNRAVDSLHQFPGARSGWFCNDAVYDPNSWFILILYHTSNSHAVN